MNLQLNQTDSYLMFLKRYNHTNDEYYWQIRSGIIVNGEVLTAEHYSYSLENGLSAMEKWYDKSLIDANESESSSGEWLPLLVAPVEMVAVKKVQKQMKDDFGVVIWGLQPNNIWFALFGTDEELFDGEWTLGEANQDLALALGGLNVRKGQNRQAWKQGMKHTQNPRMEDGRIARHQVGTAKGDKRIREHRNRIETHNQFLKTPEGQKWAKVIRNSSIKPKSE